MPSTRHLQRSARLALLAMLLLLTAPLFSQALAAARAPAWLSAMACGDHEQPAHTMPAWAQCGYCTLLLSSPALGGAPQGLQGAVVFAGSVPAMSAPGSVHELVTPYDAPPRAPPQHFA